MCSIGFVMHKYMFSLYKIGCITLRIQTSDNKASACPSKIFPRYQIEICLLRYFNLRRRYENISKNAWNSKWGVFYALEFMKEHLVESISWNVVDTVGISFAHHYQALESSSTLSCHVLATQQIVVIIGLDIFQCFLHVFGQINIV